MLPSLKELERYSVAAIGGELGSVSKVLLDDERWALRYYGRHAYGDERGTRAEATGARALASPPGAR